MLLGLDHTQNKGVLISVLEKKNRFNGARHVGSLAPDRTRVQEAGL